MLNIINNMVGFVSSVFGVISGLYFIYKYFYDHKIKFYLWVNKFFSGRREVQFKLSFAFNYIDKDLFKEFEKIAKSNKLKYTKELNTRNHKMYNFDGVIIDVNQNDILDDKLDDRNTFIRVINAGVTLRTAQDIISMFGKLTMHLPEKIKIENEMYNFQVIYPENKNPFIGMKLKLMSGNNLLSFNASINASKILENIDTGNNTKINIYKQNISINNKDYLDVSNVAKALLMA